MDHTPNVRTVLGRLGVFVLGALMGVAVCAAGAGTGAFSGVLDKMGRLGGAAQEDVAEGLTLDTVEAVVEQTSDLTVTKYRYKNAATARSSKELAGFELPLTQNTLVYTYEGVIGLGVDLAKVAYRIDNDAKTITVVLPAVKILYNELDEASFEYVYEDTSVLTPLDAADMSALHEEQRQAMAEKVMADDELLAEARSNAEDVLETFLTSSDATAGYAVSFA
jgi:hypothetical protein